MGYVQVRPGLSWHVIRTWSRVPGVAVTLCGKRASGETRDSFGDEKSCEACFRVSDRAFRAVAQPAEDRITL